MGTQNMEFRRILGFTVNGQNSFVTQPKTGNLIYIAGCVIIVYNPHFNTQNHLLTESKQTITTLAISENGHYLAAADSGSQTMIRIWDLMELILLVEIEAYDFEFVACMSFSGDGHVLMCIGSHYDYPLPRLKAWNWRSKSLLIREYVSAQTRAVSCDTSSGNFVIVSEASIQYWSLSSKPLDGPFQLNKSKLYGSDLDDSGILADTSTRISINRWDATLGIHRDKNFCDVKCGRGPKSGFTFCIARDGLLCELNEQGNLYKFVDLKTKSANCLGVSDNLIAVGCANGLIRCFNTTELKFIRNLPRPHKLGTDISSTAVSATNNGTLNQTADQTNSAGAKPTYPDVISVVSDEINNTISCVYNDHSIYIWDLSNTSCIVKRYSALYHSSCIWGVDMYPALSIDPLLPPGSFITCSSDDTIRIWQPRACNSSDPNKPMFSTPVDESLKIIFTDSTYKYLCNLDNSHFNESNNNNTKLRQNQDYDSNEGLRCLKISPNGRQLAVGSRSGAIKIYDLKHYVEMKNIAAHDAEVLCLEYSDPKRFDGFCYLASSSRDKLIHIFDVSNNYNFLQTIDDHLSTITSLKFVNNIASDCLQLVSCGADKKIIFRNGTKLPNGQLNFVTKQFIVGKSTFYDMEVDSESSCLMTACQDRMIRLFNVAQIKYQSSFKGSLSDDGTLIKIALDPSCTFLAASSTNKTINIYDHQRGVCIASVTDGLSDLVTDLKFSPDGRYLVACSGDGCIFIWASPPEIVNAVGSAILPTNLDHLSLSSCSLNSVAKPPNVMMEPTQMQNRFNNSIEQRLFGSQQVERDSDSPARFIPATNSRYSISGQFNDKQLYDGNQHKKLSSAAKATATATAIHKSSDAREMYRSGSNLRKTSNLGLSQSAHILNSDNLHVDSSDNDDDRELLTNFEDNYATRQVASGNLSISLSANKTKPNTPPKTSLYKQIRRSGYANLSGPPAAGASRLDAADYNQHSGHYMGLINSTSANRAKTLAGRRSHHQQHSSGGALMNPSFGSSSTMRPSKSECNLGFAAAAASLSDIEREQSGILMSSRNNNNFVYSDKLDLSKMNPASVPISQELCQYVVDELQAISKFATRLHQSLLQQTSSPANDFNGRYLSGLLARGVQNSMDILSIVPPRTTHPRQYQSQINLSPVNATVLQRNADNKTAQQAQQMPPLRRGVSALAISPKKATSPLCLARRPNRYATSLSADTNSLPRKAESETDASVDQMNQVKSVGQMASAKTAASSADEVDQVLESYADRLFRMIQERCDQSGADPTPALSPANSANSNRIVQ